MAKDSQFDYYSTYLIGEEAKKRGVKVEKIFPEGLYKKKSRLRLSYKGHVEIIIGQRTSQTSVVAFWIQRDKHLAKHFLRQAGIETAEGEVFSVKNEKEIISYVKKIGFPLIVKQTSGTHGDLVFLNVDSEVAIKECIDKIAKQGKKNVLIEREFIGKEYRLFATKDKFVAGTFRIPANVVGDGKSSIKDLVKEKNRDPRRSAGHSKSLVRIKIDQLVKDYLQSQKLSLESVPSKGEKIYLRPNSNLSTGGDSIDMTDKIHPAVKELAVKAIKAIPGLAYGGVDYLTKDVTKAPSPDNYIIIEINDSPMISMHHVPYEGKPRDVAKEIIDMIFPETIK